MDKITVPFITGDGVGVEITPSMQAIVNAAVQKAYSGQRQIEWMEVWAGERAFEKCGLWLPDETMEAFRDYKVGIKGPLTTPVGGGIRSLNVAPDIGLVCMSAAGSLVSGHSLSGSSSGEGEHVCIP